MGGPALPIAMGASSLLGAIGNAKGPTTGVAVPPDLAGARGQQIDLLNYLLGGSQAARGQGGSPTDRLQGFFGQYGIPQTDLQRQGAGNISNMLNANAPGSAQNVLQGMLTGTGPQFERDIASANQQGGRFSSANEILRGEALRNLYNMRTQTAGAMGALNQAGFGIGQQQAQQGDVQAQRTLQLLGGLLGLRQQGTMELPITQRPNWMQSLGGAAGNAAGLMGLFGGGGGGGGGSSSGGLWAPPGGTTTTNPQQGLNK